MASARNDDSGGGGDALRNAPLRPPLSVSGVATPADAVVSSSSVSPSTTLHSAFAATSSSSASSSPSPVPPVVNDVLTFNDSTIDLFNESDAFGMPDLGFLDALNGSDCDALLLASQGGDGDDGSMREAHDRGGVRVGGKTHVSSSFSAGGVSVSGIARDHKSPEKQQMQTAVKIKRIRKCVKRELEYLQAQVYDLEEQLAILQRTRTMAIDNVEPTAMPTTRAAVGVPPGIWERIARNQLHEKKQSEEENAKLRRLLESQIKVANSLARVLKKSPDVSWLESSGLGPLCKRSRIHDAESTGQDIYETLFHTVDSLYAQLETVFANSAGFATDTRVDTSDVQVKSDANGSTFLEFFSSKAFPFDLATTSAIAWKLAGLSLGKLPNGHYGATEATDDMVRSQASGTLHIQQAEVGIHCNMVIKRLEQEDRVVILWCVVGKSEVSSTLAPKFTIRESGWLIIRELQDLEAAQANPRYSIMKSVVHVRPEFIAIAGDKSSRGDFPPGLLTDAIMGSHLQSISATYQKMENALLADVSAMGNEASV